jgi:hypothetical protein
MGGTGEVIGPAWVRERMVELAERVLARHAALS